MIDRTPFFPFRSLRSCGGTSALEGNKISRVILTGALVFGWKCFEKDEVLGKNGRFGTRHTGVCILAGLDPGHVTKLLGASVSLSAKWGAKYLTQKMK